MIKKVWFAIRNFFVSEELTKKQKFEIAERIKSGDGEKIHTGLWN